ncbi:MAG: elongation factor P maturation arginine rhamnosyltransferase EarP [bacterium]|nr:elongation factor P maturation arginine rhamnosyltransferase EarP [bacterium]
MNPPDKPGCDLFCHIIDNYGDIGVCWRLARQLHTEFGVAVTLWVDDLAAFARLAPALDTSLARQKLDGITVRHWAGDLADAVPAGMVIEGFGCALPPAFLHAMAARRPAPVWLNLEYLSAEAWVEDCHGLASINPATGMTQHFWFPGFTPRTGGLLREDGLLAARDHFQLDTATEAAFWERIGVPEAGNFTRRLSLFSYENPAIAGLLQAASADTPSTLMLVPEGRALPEVARWAGVDTLRAGDRLHRGALSIAILPLLDHADYDRLLWGCALNLVRGEDSLVRAHWAGKPLLWHIYPQDEDAHLVKLDAFIHLVEQQSGMPAQWAEAMRAWNRGDADPALWAGLLADLPALTPPALAWSRFLGSQKELAGGLMRFYRSRVE